MEPHNKIFGTSGIRGDLARINTTFALNLGRALGTMLKGKGTVSVGTDARTSREMLKNALVSGILSTGTDVVDIGIAPLPTVAFYSSLEMFSVSIIVTASHNPPSNNGFKFFIGGREFIRSEEFIIEKHLFRNDFIVAHWQSVGSISYTNPYSSYVKAAHSFLERYGEKSDGMKVLVDLANGAATKYTPALLRDFGFSVATINSHPDGHFPGRPAEPSPQNLIDTMHLAAKTDFAVTICHDGDGDRIAIVDEEGKFIDQNRVIALFAREEVERKGFGTVVVSIDTSSVIDEVVEDAGGSVVRVPLGSLQEKIAIDKNSSIVFASEPWKPIFLEFGGWMDGIVGAVRFAQLVEELGSGSCKKLMKRIPEYPMLREHINCPDELKGQFMKKVLEMLPSRISNVEKILDVDGVRIDCSDGSYVLVRVSGTEPKARLYAGAKTKKSLNRLVGIARSVMLEALNTARSQN